MEDKQKWSQEIGANRGVFSVDFKEIWGYRDLLLLFVHRNLITTYKQTVLGPLWYFIEPLFTSVVFTLIFNNVANISTGTTPSFIYNLSGIILWSYFKICFSVSSSALSANAGMFSKVYFPRIIAPLSAVISAFFKIGIQVLVFIGFFVFYQYKLNFTEPSFNLLIFPFYIVLIGLLGMGLGLVFSGLLTKYRDMRILINFGMQLFMYLSAIMYPLSYFKEKLPEYAWIVEYNPVAIIVDAARKSLFEIHHIIDILLILKLILVVILLFTIGILVYNKAEKNFIDTV